MIRLSLLAFPHRRPLRDKEKGRCTIPGTLPLFHRFTYDKEYSAYGVPNFTILYEIFLTKNSVWTYGRLWTITLPQALYYLYYFKMLYCTSSVPPSGLPPHLANSSPSYLVTVFVYTPGRLSHKVSLPVNASCGDTWRTETTDRNYGPGNNSRNKSGEFADCKRCSKEVIRKAINSLWDAHNWACWGVADILTCYLCHIAGNWRSLVLSHHNRRFLQCYIVPSNIMKTDVVIFR